MEEIDLFLKLVSGGADVTLVAIGVAIWKLERRVYALELYLSNKKGKENEKLV